MRVGWWWYRITTTLYILGITMGWGKKCSFVVVTPTACVNGEHSWTSVTCCSGRTAFRLLHVPHVIVCCTVPNDLTHIYIYIYLFIYLVIWLYIYACIQLDGNVYDACLMRSRMQGTCLNTLKLMVFHVVWKRQWRIVTHEERAYFAEDAGIKMIL